MKKNALVTGASRGIGRAIAERLAADGFDLTLTARDEAALEALAQDLSREHGAQVAVIASDVREPSTPQRLLDEHENRFGQLDALVLNAGAGTVSALEDTTAASFTDLMNINTTSSLHFVTAAIPLMRKATQRQPGAAAKVVAVSSITGVYPQRRMAAYAASKAALRSLVESINLEHSSEGISATAVCPAYVATDMTSWLFDRIPADEMLHAVDVADLVAFLVAQSRRAVINEVVLGRAGTDFRTP